MRWKRFSLLIVAVVSTTLGPARAQDGPDLLEMLKALEGQEFLQDPPRIMAWVDVPKSVTTNEPLTLRVTIENAREGETFKLSSIDLAKEFAAGFTIVGFSPEPRNKGEGPSAVSFEYPADIAAAQTRVFEIHLRAKAPGIYIGDVDVYEGERFLTRSAQTRVRAE
jgi:hypothetical protein